MASNTGYLSLSIKAVAFSVAVVLTAVMLHISGPTILRLASSEIPKIYGSFMSLLTPPYLYFVINGIIISIAASSRFHTSGSEDVVGSEPLRKQEFVVVAPVVEEEVKVDYFAPMAEYEFLGEEGKENEKKKDEAEFLTSRSSWTPAMSKESETEKATEIPTEYSSLTEKVTEIPTEYSLLTEKPPVSARLGRRKSLKAGPEGGKALGVARPKRNDTLESTWKAITDGRAVPLTRHLKKSDTWETQHSRDNNHPSVPDPSLMHKSETFNDHRGGSCRPTTLAFPPSKLRKEPSLGRDDLNRRVEVFINKFNEEMRLQRQESFQQYLDTINRGSH